jgi:hypothetical protein
MASRPPENEAAEAEARNRWMVIQAARVGGVVMVVIGLLALRDRIALPPIAGYLLLAVGLADIFLVPQFLARKWRTPPQ